MLKDIINACLSFGTRFYSLSQIIEKSGVDRKSGRHKLWKLEAAGLIVRIKCWETPLPEFSKGRPTKEICYRNTKLLKKRAGLPRQNRENGWDKMWRVMRALRRFTRNELATLCGERIENVRYFTKLCRRLGYVRPDRERGRNITWILVRDSGPKRPREEEQGK